MSKPFDAVVFQPNQFLDKSVMDQLSSNQQWLYDNMPSALYTFNNLKRKEGVRLVGGRVLVPATKSKNQRVQVRFGNYFSAGCNPIITTGNISDSHRKFWVTLSGLGRFMPDHRGFDVHLWMASDTRGKKDFLSKNVYVTWQAMGY